MPDVRILLCSAADERPMLQAALPDAEIDWQADSKSCDAMLADREYDLLIVALQGEKASELAPLETLRAQGRSLPMLVLASRTNVDMAVAAMRLGSVDYLLRPVTPQRIAESARQLLALVPRDAKYDVLRRQIERPYRFDDMIGGCGAMQKVFATIEQVAESNVDVLIVGETGTGKELIARSIHLRSKRREAPFVPVDCGAIPENLLESEFFGHERGAFTGAEQRRIGLLEFAHGGTFFLDELGELPLLLQAKLLRTLQERRIRRVGGREEIPIDVRIVAATGRNLEEMIRLEQFRQDLYYRINVVRIDLPPLRERGDDIGLLAEHMTFRYAKEIGRDVRGLTAEAYQVLAQYHWPGNVRELQNVIRRALALAKTNMIDLDDLPDSLITAAGKRGSSAAVGYFQMRDEHIADFERKYLSELLTRHGGDVRAAAAEAELPRGTLYRLLKNHGLDSSQFK